MTEISVAEFEREEALLLYKDKMYIDEVAKLTNGLSSENEICTLDYLKGYARVF